MLPLFFTSEPTKMNSAIKPCHSPSQKPATVKCSPGVPLNWLGPAAHPARIFANTSTTTNKAQEDFMAGPPLPMFTKQGHEKSQRVYGRSPLACHPERSEGSAFQGRQQKADSFRCAP